MELYLDSANFKEIEEFFQLGFLAGLTTTPTFMHREGVKNVDELILKLSKIVPILQIEALGKTAPEIVKEAERQMKLGLKPDKTVFKIPVTWEGLKACHQIVQKGWMVNVHLVYTIQQAYMAMQAGAHYVCPLVGRLQDQGQDALSLVQSAVDMVNYYESDTKIMFSSVRNIEHVRNALQIGVQAITVPGKLMKQLTENYFTTLGTKEFFEHTNLLKYTVREVMEAGAKIAPEKTLHDGLLEMSKSKLGAVAIVGSQNQVLGIFTDGDLRRVLSKEGNKVLENTFQSLLPQNPLVISPESSLEEAKKMFQQHKVDTLLVGTLEDYQGMLDIQDLIRVVEER